MHTLVGFVAGTFTGISLGFLVCSFASMAKNSDLQDQIDVLELEKLQ